MAMFFDRIEVRPALRQVLIDGQVAPLGSRAFDVLMALIERRERIVSKQELLDVVWPDLYVEEHNLVVQIGNLRKLLGPQAISTVPGRGYRFTASSHEPRTAALASHTALPEDLPALIGRDEDLALLDVLLPTHRLVTLVGAGGIGKTRLARQLLAKRGTLHAHGMGWVELEGLTEGSQLPGAISRALGLDLGGGDPVDRLVAALRPMSLLLALDNAEHIVSAVAHLVDALQLGALGVRFVVTSQAPLGLQAEQVFRLEPLALPPAQATVADVMEHGAVALFVHRAKAADRRFVLDASNVAAVIGICRRLDGIARSIERSGLGVDVRSVAGLATALDDQLRLLRSQRRDLPQRQQTLRATLEWSHRLLSIGEQTVLRRLAVFAGGFPLELALQVVPDSPTERWEVLDALGSLVDRSLVMADTEDPPRYRLLASTHAYALEQLRLAGEEHTWLARHAMAVRHYLWRLLETRFLAFDPVLRVIEREIDNAQAAMTWALQHDPEIAVALAYPIAVAVRQSGDDRGIWAATEAVLSEDMPIRVRAEWATGVSTLNVFDTAHKTHWSRVAVKLWREIGDLNGLMAALITFTDILAAETDAERLASQEQMHQLNRDASRPVGLRVRGLLFEAKAAMAAAEFTRMQQNLDDSWLLSTTASDAFMSNCVLTFLASGKMLAGRFAEAVAHGTDLVRQLRDTRQLRLLSVALLNLCGAHLFQRAVPEARAAAIEAWPLTCMFGYEIVLGDYLALLVAMEDRPGHAAQILGCTDARQANAGLTRQGSEQRAVEQAASIARARLGDAEFDRQYAMGIGIDNSAVEALAFFDNCEQGGTPRSDSARRTRARP